MHFNTSLPLSLSALNFAVIIARRRAPFRGRERRRLAAGRSMRSEVQAAQGRQGLQAAPPVRGLLSGAVAGPSLCRAVVRGAAGSSRGFALLKAGFIPRRKGKEEG